MIDQPGEYEIGDFTVRGIAARRNLDAEDSEKLATVIFKDKIVIINL